MLVLEEGLEERLSISNGTGDFFILVPLVCTGSASVIHTNDNTVLKWVLCTYGNMRRLYRAYPPHSATY